MKIFCRAFLCFLWLGTALFGTAWAGATLYRGGAALGVVATVEGPSSDLWVSIEDVGALLGFSSLRMGEELRLMRGNVQLRLLLNAVAAWRGLSLVSLHAAPIEKDGRMWIDAPSAATLFQRDGRLRFQAAQDAPAPTVNPVPEPAPPLSIPEPAVPAPVPATPTPATPTSPASTPAAHMPATPVSETPAPENGEILRLRWGTSAQKIRGVVDASDGAEPKIWVEGGVVHALFASAAENPAGIPSPFENVKVTLTRGERGAELVFASNGVRVEKLLLNSPRRIVFDFYFAPGTRIQAAAKPALPQASVPQLTAPTPQPQAPAPVPQKGTKKRVVVDPGHGGKDPGTAANNVREKDVNLAIGLELEKVLKAQGFDVVMTRRTDVYLKLQERTDIANRAKADVFVSVHVNALPSAKKASGFEIYIMALPTDKDALALAKIENQEYAEGKAGNSEEVDRKTEMLLKILGDMQQNNKINESTDLAEKLFAAGKGNGLPMRRVAQAPFFVLRGAGMPAVLLETGFVTNATEAKLLAHPGYRQRIAQAMAEGIANYLR